MATESTSKIPWRQGYWKMDAFSSLIMETADNNFLSFNLVALDYPRTSKARYNHVMKCQFGNFGLARKEVAEATQAEQYNFQMVDSFIKLKGVLNQEGTKITLWGTTNKLEEWFWLDEERIERMKNNREPYEAPSCKNITPNPSKRGKIVWVSGPPGAGKSTTCQLLARENSFIYYEGDCIPQFLNPFTDVYADNPSMACASATPLKGVPEEVAIEVFNSGLIFKKLFNGEVDEAEYFEMIKPYYQIIADNIVRQHRRVGGTFAVAYTVPLQVTRKYLRKLIGPDLIFVILNLSRECQVDRLKKRHGDSMTEEWAERPSIFQPAGPDEEGSHNITVDSGMSKEDVVRKVSELLEKNTQN